MSTKNQENSQDPAKVASTELSDQQLDGVAGGTPGALRGTMVIGTSATTNIDGAAVQLNTGTPTSP
jgi:hypothetical protein